MLEKGIINIPVCIVIMLIMLFISLTSYAQKIKIVDKDTGAPIEHVNVYSDKGNSTLSNKEGIVDISAFKHYAVLNFQHTGYNKKSIPPVPTGTNLLIIDLTEKIIRFDEVVISGTRWEQSKEDIPNKIVTIGPKQIGFKNPATSADLIQETGQIFVQKSQLGGGSPMIRGFAANSVLIVVDGIRMNNAIFRSGNLQNIISIDPNTLAVAEVIFGPGSVIYGSDALGGVMNFQTTGIKLAKNNKLFATGEFFVRGATAAREKTIHGKINLSNNKFGSLTSVTLSDYSDLITGNQRTEKFPDYGKRKSYVEHIDGEDQIVTNDNVNRQRFSGYNQLNFLQKFQYTPNPKLQLQYAFNFSNTSNIPRYDRLIETDESGNPNSAEWYYGPQKWMVNALLVNFDKRNFLFDHAKFIVANQRIEESRNNRNFMSNLRRTRQEKVNVYSLNIDFEKVFDIDRRLFYGLESVNNKIQSNAYGTDIITNTISKVSTRYPAGGSRYTSIAGYLNYNWKFASKFVTTAGARYSWVGINAKPGQQDYEFEFEELNIKNQAVNGSWGLVFKPSKSWQLDLLTSSGFRSPNIDDIGKIFDGSNGVVTVPNPNLKPEFSYNVETTASKIINSNLKLSATVYFTKLVNAMVIGDYAINGQDSIIFEGELSKVFALQNTGKANLYGGSVGLHWDIGMGWTLKSHLTISEGRDIENNQPLRHTTPVFSQTELKYQSKKFTGALILKTSSKRAFEDLAPIEQAKTHLYTTDGSLAWQVLNIRTGFHFNDYWSVTGGIENILDKHYRPYSSGISAPGRNFYLNLAFKF